MREVSAHLPVPAWRIKPTISGDNIVIVGYTNSRVRYNACYLILTEELILSFDKSLSPDALPIRWEKFSVTTHKESTTIPYSNPPIIVGGHSRIHSNQGIVRTSDVSLYDIHKNSWRKVDSLTSARDNVGIDLLNNHTVIVIGGATSGVGVEGAMESCLCTVEIGTIVPNQ